MRMSNLRDILDTAPDLKAGADKHIRYAERLLVSGNADMAERIDRNAGATSPPHQFAMAQVHIDLARAKIAWSRS